MDRSADVFASVHAMETQMKLSPTRTIGAALVALLATAILAPAFADAPGTNEGRDAAIAAVEQAAAAKRAQEEARKRAVHPQPASPTGNTTAPASH
jgi:hypothetical protein